MARSASTYRASRKRAARAAGIIWKYITPTKVRDFLRFKSATAREVMPWTTPT